MQFRTACWRWWWHWRRLGHLGYTSLRLLELSIAVERVFALPPLSHDTLAGVSTVGDLVNLVRAQKDLR